LDSLLKMRFKMLYNNRDRMDSLKEDNCHVRTLFDNGIAFPTQSDRRMI